MAPEGDEGGRREDMPDYGNRGHSPMRGAWSESRVLAGKPRPCVKPIQRFTGVTSAALRDPHQGLAFTLGFAGDTPLSAFLKFAVVMDWISEKLGKFAGYTVLAASLISAANALVRYGFDFSNNAFLEIQWYLFAATVMLGAPVVLRYNEHVRVDIIYGKLKGYGPVYVDLFGLVFFLLPVMGTFTYLTWPYFWNTWVTGEMSGNIGGLVRWPAALLMPVGFAAMFLQGVSEIVKRIAYLRGLITMDTHYEKPVQ